MCYSVSEDLLVEEVGPAQIVAAIRIGYIICSLLAHCWQMGKDSLIVFLSDLVLLMIMTVILLLGLVLREDYLVTVNKGKIAHIEDTIGSAIIFYSCRDIFIIQLSRMLVCIM